MPFNPFVWNNVDPQATQNISTGQTTLLNNINFLGFPSPAALTANGFIQFPNGLIIQWGKNVPVGGIVDTVAVTFSGTFPGCSAFTNNCFGVWLSPIKTSIVPHAFVLSAASVSTTGFTISTDTTWNQGYYMLALGN